MIIKTILSFALLASTIALPVDNPPPEKQERPKVTNDAPTEQQIVAVQSSEENDRSDDLLPPVEEANPLVIDGPAPSNPVAKEGEKSDLDTANTFGFGYGWGYRPYYGGYGGWRRGWGFGGYGGGYGGYGLGYGGFYGRTYSPWGWGGGYYY